MDDAGSALFELPEEDGPASPEQETPISDEQVAMLRHAFDDAGIADMETRQEIVQSCSIRPITNIRMLYAREFRTILARIKGRSQGQSNTQGSAWDNRDEDTWIDRLYRRTQYNKLGSVVPYINNRCQAVANVNWYLREAGDLRTGE